MAAESVVAKELERLTQDFIESSSPEHQNNAVKKIVNILSTSESNGILSVVEVLGAYLGSEETTQRRKGTQLLAELMHRLPQNCLKAQETELLTLFFIDRLKDHHSVQPQVIYGLLGLVSFYKVASDHIVKICQTAFAEVHVRSLVQADRRNVFNLYSNLLEKYAKPLQRMGPDFVLGFIQSMDGEKDPRNLIVCFQNVEQIVSKLQFEVFAEDLFEVTSCYFPIDFTPPSNDPYGITKEELVTSLRRSLSTTRVFAPFLIPLLMEKVSSDIIDAKIESFLTLASSLGKYKAEDICKSTQEIWSALRNDYLLGGIKAIETPGLDALKGVIICLGSQMELCVDFVSMIIKDCEQALKDPDLNIPEQLGQVLLTVTYSCPEVCKMVLPRILQFLTSMLTEQQNKGKLISVLHIIQKLLEYADVANEFDIPNIVQEKKHDISAFLLTNLCSSDDLQLICISMRCLLAMLNHRLLPPDETNIFFQNIILQMSKARSNQVLDTVFSCISTVSVKKLETSSGYLTKELQNQIQKLTSEGSARDALTLKNTFEALFLTLHANNVKIITKDLIEMLVNNCGMLTEILQFIIKAINKYPTETSDLESFILPKLLKFIQNGSEAKLINITELWNLYVEVLRTLICSLPATCQEKWIVHVAGNFLPEGHIVNDDISKKHSWGQIFMTVNHSKKLALANAFYCGLRKSVEVPHLQMFQRWLQIEIRDSEEEKSTQCGCKTYASIINKLPEGETLDHALNEITQFIEKSIKDDTLSASQRENMIILFLWVCKAVVIRWHTQAPIISSKVVSLIQDTTISKYIGEHFSILVAEDSDCLNERTYANRKMMYKQRFIEFILPKLVAAYKKSEDIARSTVSKAISHLFQHLPKKILHKQLYPIIPLLIRSLSFSDPVILSSTLTTFNSLESPDALKGHVTSLIPRLLSLAKAPESMQLRLQAILCLKFLCNLPVHSIYPYQLNVIKSLKTCLNDKKRLVRKEASKCRNQWYLLKGDS